MNKTLCISIFLVFSSIFTASCSKRKEQIKIEKCVIANRSASAVEANISKSERLVFSISGVGIEALLKKDSKRLRLAYIESCYPYLASIYTPSLLYSKSEVKSALGLDDNISGDVYAIFDFDQVKMAESKIGGACLQIIDSVPWEGGQYTNKAKVDSSQCKP